MWQVDNVLDRVRWFAEECDHLQGVQLLTDATNVCSTPTHSPQLPSLCTTRAHVDSHPLTFVLRSQAWAGVADAVVKELRDEYDRTPVSQTRMAEPPPRCCDQSRVLTAPYVHLVFHYS